MFSTNRDEEAIGCPNRASARASSILAPPDGDAVTMSIAPGSLSQLGYDTRYPRPDSGAVRNVVDREGE